MLIFGDNLINLPVGSIQAEHRVGTVTDYIVDPNKLHIVALYVQTKFAPKPLILYTGDIKNFTRQGLVIDHNDRLMDSDNLVRLKEVIDINFSVSGKQVVTENKRKLGRVVSFAFDVDTFLIMRLNVRQSMIKNISTSELIVHRQQIVSVTDKQIIVRSQTIKDKAATPGGWRRWLFGAKPAGISPEPSPIKTNDA